MRLSILWRSRRVLSIEAQADNTLRDLHNSSYDTKAVLNNCFIIQNNSQFQNIAKTSLPTSMLSLFQIAGVALRAVFLLFLQCFQPLFRLVPAVVLTLETSGVSAILVFATNTTQPRPQVFSVNCALTSRRLHF